MQDSVRGVRRPPGRADWAVPRRRMVERLAAAGIEDRRVLAAFAAVPRHLLVPEALQAQRAYATRALPIGDRPDHLGAGHGGGDDRRRSSCTGTRRVLEIGTGSGYQAAVLGQLAARVISVERVPALAAARVARSTGSASRTSSCTWATARAAGPDDAPFDAIVVTAGGPEMPEPLLAQLAIGGRLVGPFGPRGEQRLVRVRRDATARMPTPRNCSDAARFVDLVGKHGWGAERASQRSRAARRSRSSRALRRRSRAGSSRGDIVHVLQPGENLYRSSRYYGVRSTTIARERHRRRLGHSDRHAILVIPGARRQPPDVSLAALRALEAGRYRFRAMRRGWRSRGRCTAR